MPFPTEQQDLNQNTGLLQNDKVFRDFLKQIMSRSSLGLNIAYYSSSTDIDPKANFAIIDTTSGVVNLNLPYANYWSSNIASDKTPLIFVNQVSGANACNINVQLGNTIAGGSSLTLTLGTTVLLVSDGNTNWYTVSGSGGSSSVNTDGITVLGDGSVGNPLEATYTDRLTLGVFL